FAGAMAFGHHYRCHHHHGMMFQPGPSGPPQFGGPGGPGPGYGPPLFDGPGGPGMMVPMFPGGPGGPFGPVGPGAGTFGPGGPGQSPMTSAPSPAPNTTAPRA
ncbi:MAG: hypothetical protein WCE76_21645, partial [Mycobacterium sp.]